MRLPRQRPDFYFYPRSPCGERLGNYHGRVRPKVISIHALLAESDHWHFAGPVPTYIIFLSTLSLRRATRLEVYKRHYLEISIHALLAESDFACPIWNPAGKVISIHALLAESDWAAVTLREVLAYFYPRSPCGERRTRTYEGRQKEVISIHALLAESDAASISHILLPGYFYPRSPCGERRVSLLFFKSAKLFLSTLSLRRATAGCGKCTSCQSDFYPRSPCGERPVVQLNVLLRIFISIHALLAESDASMPLYMAIQDNFYPRSPCGERPRNIVRTIGRFEFLSTLSLRRATDESTTAATELLISIHALLAESDNVAAHFVPHHADFYPRSPCGERRTK